MVFERGGLDGRVTVRMTISGLVQGVGFRDAARSQAQRLALRGWVRNLPDGTVELVAQGPVQAMEELRAWCARGPRTARVTGVLVEHVNPAGRKLPAGFIVAR
ncbi:MAG: acylphosphatase [Bacillota bacterium]|nr:acylphosphatase [Bacillota bacterium]